MKEKNIDWGDILPMVPDNVFGTDIMYSKQEKAQMQYMKNIIYDALRKTEAEGKICVNPPDNVFINHVKSHLVEGQHVVCRICGKLATDIYAEWKAERDKS